MGHGFSRAIVMPIDMMRVVASQQDSLPERPKALA